MKTKSAFLKILIPFLLLPPVVQAGDKAGNGGDAIVCLGNKEESVILLDKYEATKRKFILDIPGDTLRRKVTTLIGRMIKMDTGMGDVYNLALEMVKDIELRSTRPHLMKLILMSNDPLKDIDDSNETAIPAGCFKEQLVVNKDVVYDQDFKFEIRSDLWDKMGLNDQALTITHEAIYNWLIKNGASDSRYARYLNGFFAQNESKANFESYVRSSQKARAVIPRLEIELPRIWSKVNPQDLTFDNNMVTWKRKDKLLEGQANYLSNGRAPYISNMYMGHWDFEGNLINKFYDGNYQELKDFIYGIELKSKLNIKFNGLSDVYTMVVDESGAAELSSNAISSVLVKNKKT